MNLRKATALILMVVLLLAAAGGPAAAGSLTFLPGGRHQAGTVSGLPYVPGEVIVKFKPEIKAADAKAGLLSAHRALGLAEKKALPRNSSLLKVAGDVEEAIKVLQRDPRVAYAQPNYIYKVCQEGDPLFGQQWGLVDEQYGTKAPGAWNQFTSGSQDVIVAVIDTGVDYNHPDLKDNIWHNPGEIPDNNKDDDGNGYIDDTVGYDFIGENALAPEPVKDNDPMDDYGHGTHVAGIIAATANNGEGIAGVAPGVKIMALKAADSYGFFTTAAIVDAIDYAATKGAKVVNMSFGTLPSDDPRDPTKNFDRDLYDAISRYPSILFVAASGNEGNNNDELPIYPACFNRPNAVYDPTSQEWVTLSALSNVISVAALAPDGSMASFSNFGPESVNLAAPGEGILSTVPAFGAAGIALTVSDVVYNDKVMLWGFGAEALADSSGGTSTTGAVYDSVVRAVYDFLGITPAETLGSQGRPLLVVDDDQSGEQIMSPFGLIPLPDVSALYLNALSTAGYVYETCQVPYGEDCPSVDAAVYSGIVWFTGWAPGSEWDNQLMVITKLNLTDNDHAFLAGYLESGGRLFLSGWAAGYGAQDFLANYLHAQMVGQTENLVAADGAGPYEGVSYNFAVPAYFSLFQPANPGSATVVLSPRPYASWSGTSMAAPFVSGGAALAFSLRNDLAPSQLINILKENVTPLDDLRDKTASGGTLNLADALAAVKALSQPGDGGNGGGGGTLPKKEEPAPGTAEITATGEAQSAEVLDGRVVINIPAGALPKDARLVIKLTAEAPENVPAGAVAPSPVISFETAGSLGKPVKIGIKYNPDKLGQLDPRALQVFRQNGDGTWTAVGGKLDRQKGTVAVELDHFSNYTLFALARDFRDAAGHWAQKDIAFMAARGVIGGYEDGTFRPEKAVTRAELASLLVKLLGLPEVRPQTPTFADVDPAAWYYAAVETAARAKLLAGDGRRFRPDDTLTREEMAAVAVRIAGLSGLPGSLSRSNFADEQEIAPWAREAVAIASAHGLMRGVGNQLFAPRAGVTRAQSATLLTRLGDRRGLFEQTLTLEGSLVMSTVEGPHFELVAADNTYVLVADRSDRALSSWLNTHLGQTVRVTGYLVPGPNIYMRGPVLRVIRAESLAP